MSIVLQPEKGGLIEPHLSTNINHVSTFEQLCSAVWDAWFFKFESDTTTYMYVTLNYRPWTFQNRRLKMEIVLNIENSVKALYQLQIFINGSKWSYYSMNGGISLTYSWYFRPSLYPGSRYLNIIHILFTPDLLQYMTLYIYIYLWYIYIGISWNRGTSKSSTFIVSALNHPFMDTPIYGNLHIYLPFSGIIQNGNLHLYIYINIYIFDMETSIFMEISRYSYINTDICPSQEEHSPSLGSCLYTVNLAKASGRPGRKRAD